MGRLPGNIAGSPKKAIITNIPDLLQTFRIYYKHFGFVTNIPDLLVNYYQSLPSSHFQVTM